MIRVAAFYRFAALAECGAIRDRLAAICTEAGTKGTILIAPEGVNGAVAAVDPGRGGRPVI